MHGRYAAGLGVAALPLSSYAAESEQVTVTAQIDDTLSITAGEKNVNLGILSSANINTGSTTVTVGATGVEKAYNLYVKATDAQTGLKHATEEDVIPAVPGLTAGTTGWSVKSEVVDSWQAVTAYTEDGVLLRSNGTADTDDGEDTEVTFGASIASGHGLENGSYSNKVVFIAVATAN